MKITKNYLRSILLEEILLEIRSVDILNKYPVMNDPKYNYSEAINMIKNKGKYLRFLDKMLGQFVSDIEGIHALYKNISYGQIIFCVLMHEKYSQQKGKLPPEYLDPYKIPDYKTLIQIIDDIDARFVQQNLAAYEKLKRKDELATEDYANSEESDTNVAELLSQKYKAIGGDLNRDVSGGLGLILHASIDGWDILRPYTTPGSQAIGVGSWCTVYGGHWETYNDQGITLYYVAKQKPDRSYDDPVLYKRDECYSDPEIYNDNFSIGFKGPSVQSIVLPGGNGGPSVWGNQKGVKSEDLDKVLGPELAEKIINYIKGHFNITGHIAIKDNGKNEESKAAVQNRAMQDVKPLRARARTKAIFKQHLETIADPKERLAFTMNILRSTHLNPEVLDYIYMRNVPRVKDSRMAQAELAQNGLFPYIVISLVGGVHTEVSSKIKDSIAFLTLTDEYLFDPHSDESKSVKIAEQIMSDYENVNLLEPPAKSDIYQFVPKSQFRSQQGNLGLFSKMFFSDAARNDTILELLYLKVTDQIEGIIYGHSLTRCIRELVEGVGRVASTGHKAGKAYYKFEELILAGKFDDILIDRIQEIFGFYLTPDSKSLTGSLKTLVEAFRTVMSNRTGQMSSMSVRKYILDKFLPVMEDAFKESERIATVQMGGVDKLEYAMQILPGLFSMIKGHVEGKYELPSRALELISLAADAMVRSRTQYNFVFRDMLPHLYNIPGFDIGTSAALAEYAKHYSELCAVLTDFQMELRRKGINSNSGMNIPDPSTKVSLMLRYVDNFEDAEPFYKTMFDSINRSPGDRIPYKIKEIGRHMSKDNPMDKLEKLEVIESGYDQIKLLSWSPEDVEKNVNASIGYPPIVSSLFFVKVMEEAIHLVYPLIKHKPGLYRAMVADTLLAMKYIDNDKLHYSVGRGVSSLIPSPSNFYNFLGEKLNLAYQNGLKGIVGYPKIPYEEYVTIFKTIAEVPIQEYAKLDFDIKPGWSKFKSQFQAFKSGNIAMPSILSEGGEELYTNDEESEEDYY